MGASCTKQRHVSLPGEDVGLTGGVSDAFISDRQQQGHVLRATPGTLMAAARIRRGNVLLAYTISGEVLGTGISGPIRLAVDRRTGRKYACKLFSKIDVGKDRINMLRNEAQVYLRIDHPNIARLIELWEDETAVCLIIEFCSGGELYEKLCARRLFSEITVKKITQQMFLAINYLHSRNIVHRDLKLENWLYQNPNENSDLKLIDFGFSKIWSSKSKRMHATCGTIVYVSPDILIGGYTNACDIWSLGVIVYMLLVGYPPFYGQEEEMFTNILDARYSISGPRWSKVSAACKDFVRRLLQKDPNKRLTAKEALEHPWLSRAGLLKPQIVLDDSIVNSLHKFSTVSRFQRIAFVLMAYSMTTEQFKGMSEIFIACDSSKTGTLTLHDFQALLTHVTSFSAAEILRVFKYLDYGGNDQVHFSAAMLTHHIKISDDLLKSTFLKLDLDNSGFISFDNLLKVLGESFSLKSLSTMFTEADMDGNGLIDYAEFVQLTMGEGPKKAVVTQREIKSDNQSAIIPTN